LEKHNEFADLTRFDGRKRGPTILVRRDKDIDARSHTTMT